MPFYKMQNRKTNEEEDWVIPEQIKLKDDSVLEFFKEKEKGGSAGGFYEDKKNGKKYIVKFSEYNAPREEKLRYVPLFDYNELLLNNIARIVLGENSTAPHIEISHYEQDGEIYPCFVSELIPNYSDISDLSHEEEKKKARLKFHPAFAFYALIANDDIYDQNLGIALEADGKSHATNVDFGLKPSFLFAEQESHNAIVDQLASFISHQNSVGGHYFRRTYFGYDSRIDPRLAEASEPRKENDINFYDVILGIKNIIEKKENIFEGVDSIIKEIAGDKNISKEIQEKLKEDFSKIKTALRQRINFLENNFSSDIELFDQNKIERNLKWRHHPKFKEFRESAKRFDEDSSKAASDKNIFEMARLMGIKADSTESMREKILQFDLRLLSDDLRKELKTFAENKFVLQIMVMNKDFDMVKWLLNNEVGNVTQRYSQRNHNPHFYAHLPLAIAIGLYNDEILYEYDKDKSGHHEMIDYLQGKFFSRFPKDETNWSKVNFPTRMCKLLFDQYLIDKEEFKRIEDNPLPDCGATGNMKLDTRNKDNEKK